MRFMTIPTITVVTVCYNAEKEIEKTMISVLSQTLKNIEYIIVDGASRDGTLDVVNRVMTRYPSRKIRVICEPDKGIYDAMNKGIKAADGEWVHMMNAGDTYVDEKVLENVFSADIPKSISVLYSDFYTNVNGVRIRGIIDLKNKPTFNHQCTIYRKSLHIEHGFYTVTKPIIISDILFFYAVPTKKMLKVDTVIANYDYSGVSAQGNWSLQQWLCADVVFRRRSFWNMVMRYIYVRTVVTLTPRWFREWLKSVFKFA